MKKIIIILLIVSTYYVYNTYIFQCFFYPQEFYQPILYSKFNPTIEGEHLKASIIPKHNCKHGIFIVLNDYYLTASENHECEIKVKITSDEQILYNNSFSFSLPELVYGKPNGENFSYIIFQFDTSNNKNKVMDVEITILNPVNNLTQNQDQVYLKIMPTYSWK